MGATLSEAFELILEHFPTEAERPSEAMPGVVSQAFEGVVDRLSDVFSVRASATYEIQHNADLLDSRRKLPRVEFAPDREARNDRNPRLRVMVLFPRDMRGMFLVLTDVRRQGVGPSESERSQQRERLRALLGQESELAWQFDSGTPRLVVGEGEDRDSDPFAVGTVYYRFYGADELPGEEEVLKDLDALLRLQEIYGEKFRSKDLLEDTREEPEPAAYGDGGGRGAEPVGGLGEESVAEELSGEVPETRNLLLYGPPGTGKTYSTKRRAVELCGELEPDQDVEKEELDRRYRRLRSEGRIGFVTFHQSFGYEEFVEGIRPVMADGTDDSEESGSELDYQCEMGVFKRMALLAASEGLDLKEDDRQFEARWRALQKQVETKNEVTCASRMAEYRVETLDSDRFRLVRIDGDKSTTYKVEKKSVKRWWNNRHQLGTDFEKLGRHEVDSILTRPGDFTPNWVLYRLIMELGDVEQTQFGEGTGNLKGTSQEKRINNASTYLDERREERGTDAFTGFEGARPYVLIIDEINRGNISKILGELITLLEPSKRLTRDDELLVKLPYSKETFGVPPNLHVLGTMNTADRSIALLDAALRRRFEYREMMPDSEVVVEVLKEKFGVEAVDELDDEAAYISNLAVALLETINERIEFLYDRDHQIGHSYFLEATDLDGLREAFVERIVPLLQEYFYGTWHQLGLVLGCPVDRRGNPERDRTDEHAYDGEGGYAAPMVRVDGLDEQRILRMDHEDYEDQLSWEVHPEFETTDDADRLKAFFEAILPPNRVEAVRAREYVTED